MDYFSHLLSTIKDFSILGYLIISVLAFFESFAFVGLIIPGSVAVIIGGFLVAQGVMDIVDLFIFTSIGAILGDSLSFYLGQKGVISFKESNRIFKPSLLLKGELFFKKHGGKSVFWGRFVGWVRPIVPFVAGVFNLDKKTFYFWNILSGLLWAITHIALGFFFGQAWETIVLWTTRGSIFIVALTIFIFILYVLKLFILKKGKQIFLFSLSVLYSILHAIKNNKDIQRTIKKHYQLFNFLKNRFDKTKFSGLSTTIILFTFIYTIFLFIGTVEDVLTSDVVTSIDTRIANLFIIFRNIELTHFFLWVTLLGKWQVVMIFALASICILWILHKRRYIAPLLLAIVGSEIFTTLGKIIIHRQRPDMAIYIEHSFSFPSGHATIAIAFYGFLIYLLIRNVGKWRAKVNIFITGTAIILLIGFSRLYLGVHYVSDVWGGYLVGAMWLIVAISITELLHSITKNENPFIPTVRTKIISITLIFLSFLFYVSFSFNNQPKITLTQVWSDKTTIQNIPGFLLNSNTRYTETLTGGKQEPISFIIFANNDDEFVHALIASGWFLADKISISSLKKIAEDAILKKQYLNAPMTPSFWNKQPHDFGFEKPTKVDNVRQRHHARFWKTNYITKSGQRVYVGTASFDSGIKWGVTHKIEPAIDTEREFLFNDILNSKVILTYKKQKFVNPTLGKNFSGDQFFTDGQVYIIKLTPKKDI
jgi:undecaprenyl-diphosphatase